MSNMDVTRRSVARILAATAAVPALVLNESVAQTPPPAPSSSPDAELDTARALMRANAQKLAQVKLPMAVEPAFKFRA